MQKLHTCHAGFALENQTWNHYILYMRRKRRSDRNHIIYEISIKSMTYIGVTVVEKGNKIKSLRRRWQKHVCRANRQDLNWKLYDAIRKYGPEKFDVKVIEIVRGKVEAHLRERQLIREQNPRLNTDVRVKKVCK